MRQIIKSFCDSACVCPSVNTLTVAFLVNQQKSERVRWGQYRITPSTIFPQKAPNFGSWIGVFKPNSQNQKRAYYQNYCIDSNHILHSDKDHQMPFVGGPHTHYTSKMADGRHLGKIEKIVISQPQFERFRQNLASRCSSTLLTDPTIKKIWNFKNQRWRRPLFWKI